MNDMTKDEILKLCKSKGSFDAFFYFLLIRNSVKIESKKHYFYDSFQNYSLCSTLQDSSTSPDGLNLHYAIEKLIENPNPDLAIQAGKCICFCCGQHVPVFFDGENHFIKDDCTFESGPYSVDIAVPSGRIGFANDLRAFFPDVDYDVNKSIGLQNTARDYARYGMYHPFVGNTSPSVFQESDTSIKIGYGESEDYDDPKTENEDHMIITDLWWLSICDMDVLKKRMKLSGEKYRESDEVVNFVLNVKPGIYRCTTYDKPDCSMTLISEDIPPNFTRLRKLKTEEIDYEARDNEIEKAELDSLKALLCYYNSVGSL